MGRDLWDVAATGQVKLLYTKLKQQKHRAVINGRDRLQQTPLHVAALYGHRDMCKALLDHGAELNPLDVYGRTPLMFACSKQQLEVARLLIERGCEVNRMDEKGWNALQHAIRYGNDELISLLLEHDANVNEANQNGVTALHWCARYGLTNLARMLLESGAHVNCVNTGGWTPLHEAASHNQRDMVRLLLENGVDVNIRTVEQLKASELSSDGVVTRLLCTAETQEMTNSLREDANKWKVLYEEASSERKHTDEELDQIYTKLSSITRTPNQHHPNMSSSSSSSNVATTSTTTTAATPTPRAALTSSSSTPLQLVEETLKMTGQLQSESQRSVALETQLHSVTAALDQLQVKYDQLSREHEKLVVDHEQLQQVRGAVDSLQQELEESRHENVVLKERIAELESVSVPTGDNRVTSFLQQLGLKKFSYLFHKEEITYEQMLKLTEEDLIRLGLNTVLSMIEQMRYTQAQQQRPEPTAPPSTS